MAPPPPPTEAELRALPDEMLSEILLRVSTPADLVHAATTSKRWRALAAAILSSYRKRQPSSTFLGIYVPREFAGPPVFHKADSILAGGDAARDLKAAALRASDFGEIRRYQDHRLHDDAFILGRLGVHLDCRLLDCYNSRLLLTRGDEALEVHSPLARESILLPFPPDVVDPYCLQACLLHGHDEAPAASFRVVYLQHRRLGQMRQARAVEYESRRKSWQDHPWETIKSNIEGAPEKVMHAGHRIFCKYTGQTSAALVLDTKNMQFSILPLPSYRNFAIGEMEDNVCCFVESDGCADHRLKVWQLDEERLHWDLKKNVKMDQVLGEHVGYYHPRTICNGIALLCSGTKHRHFVVDLKTFSMKEKFEFHGQSAYPMQTPWPPVFSALTANATGGDGGPASLHDTRNADANARTGARESERINDPSPVPSMGGGIGTDHFLEVSSIAPPAQMVLTAASSCPHQNKAGRKWAGSRQSSIQYAGRKWAGSRQSKGSPKALFPRRRNWKQKPKYLKAMVQRMRRLFSIASKISDDVHIATSSCREASSANTAAVSTQVCKLLLGDSGSTFESTDVRKQPIIDVSITSAPSLSYPSAGESAEQRSKVAQDSNESQDFDIQDPTATAPTSAAGKQCFGKDKNNVPNDSLNPEICDQFSHLMNPKDTESHHPERRGFDLDVGPASVGDARTGFGESDTIQDLFRGTLAMAPPAVAAVEPEEPLVWRSQSPFCVQNLDNDLLLQPPALANCPQQDRKQADSRENAGSPEAKDPARRNWKQKPKFLETIFALRRHHSISIASKISDEVQIATSSCREASAATATVSAGEHLLGGPGSPFKSTDVGKQPIIDVSITSAPSLEARENYQSLGEPKVLKVYRRRQKKLTPEYIGGSWGKGSPEATGRGRRQKKLNPKYVGGDWLLDDDVAMM